MWIAGLESLESTLWTRGRSRVQLRVRLADPRVAVGRGGRSTSTRSQEYCTTVDEERLPGLGSGFNGSMTNGFLLCFLRLCKSVASDRSWWQNLGCVEFLWDLPPLLTANLTVSRGNFLKIAENLLENRRISCVFFPPQPVALLIMCVVVMKHHRYRHPRQSNGANPASPAAAVPTPRAAVGHWRIDFCQLWKFNWIKKSPSHWETYECRNHRVLWNIVYSVHGTLYLLYFL